MTQVEVTPRLTQVLLVRVMEGLDLLDGTNLDFLGDGNDPATMLVGVVEHRLLGRIAERATLLADDFTDDVVERGVDADVVHHTAVRVLALGGVVQLASATLAGGGFRGGGGVGHVGGILVVVVVGNYAFFLVVVVLGFFFLPFSRSFLMMVSMSVMNSGCAKALVNSSGKSMALRLRSSSMASSVDSERLFISSMSFEISSSLYSWSSHSLMRDS